MTKGEDVTKRKIVWSTFCGLVTTCVKLNLFALILKEILVKK
jgi:hypothetical protein